MSTDVKLTQFEDNDDIKLPLKNDTCWGAIDFEKWVGLKQFHKKNTLCLSEMKIILACFMWLFFLQKVMITYEAETFTGKLETSSFSVSMDSNCHCQKLDLHQNP